MRTALQWVADGSVRRVNPPQWLPAPAQWPAEMWTLLPIAFLPDLALPDHRREFFAVAEIEFGAGPVDVAFHGASRHDEALGDVTVGQALSDKVGDLAFACAQRQRLGGQHQRGSLDAATGGGEPVCRRRRLHGAAAITRGIEQHGGLGGGVGGRQQGTDLLELFGRRVDRRRVAVGQCGGMRAVYGREPATDTGGDVDDALQRRAVTEADRVVQGAQFDRPLPGFSGDVRRR